MLDIFYFIWSLAAGRLWPWTVAYSIIHGPFFNLGHWFKSTSQPSFLVQAMVHTHWWHACATDTASTSHSHAWDFQFIKLRVEQIVRVYLSWWEDFSADPIRFFRLRKSFDLNIYEKKASKQSCRGASVSHGPPRPRRRLRAEPCTAPSPNHESKQVHCSSLLYIDTSRCQVLTRPATILYARDNVCSALLGMSSVRNHARPSELNPRPGTPVGWSEVNETSTTVSSNARPRTHGCVLLLVKPDVFILN
jgi:hypothetical protein